jgi:DUF4097 and DUF4098 domain-containing protein YvlB
MKKIAIILVAVGLVLTVATLSILQINGVDWWGDMRRVNQPNLQARSKTIAPNDINKITINSDDNQVKIVPAEDGQITIDYFTTDNVDFTIDVANGEVVMRRQDHSPRSFLSFGFGTIWGVHESALITLHVPADSRFTYDVRTSNGRIEAADLAANWLTVETSNAEIALSHLRVENGLTASSSNARLTMKNIEAGSLDLATSNGGVEIDQVRAGSVAAETSNARIAFDGLTADDIRFNTSNSGVRGRINGRFDDYRKDMQTSSYMRLRVDGTEYASRLTSERGEKSLRVSTSNGEVEVDFTER